MCNQETPLLRVAIIRLSLQKSILSCQDLNGINSQENEGEQSSHNNHSYQHGREDSRYGDNSERDHQSELQERVHVEGKHSVHLLLISGEAVENAACWCCVKETHGTGENLKKKKNLRQSSSTAHW